jgi:endonuclease/exonuclease/phosphatase family metal-dependent hydrolase
MPISVSRSCMPAKQYVRGLARLANLLVALSMVVLLPASTAGRAQAASSGVGRNIKVMTRNIDSGTDYGPLFVAATKDDFANAVTFVYQEVLASQPAQRAAGIAQEIASAEPDLVSLQEVETWYTGSLAATSPVTTVTVDQLAALLDALASMGQQYQAIAVANEFDMQAPSSLGFTVRVSDRDVILARTDGSFTYGNVQTGQYQAALVVPTAVGPVRVPRGWASVDVNDRQGSFRFIATHLEAFMSTAQLSQAQELVAGPANTTLPVVLAGDLNTAAAGGPDSSTTYQWLTSPSGGGLRDAWSTANLAAAGYTYPLYLEDPDRPASPTERIDLILTRGALWAKSAAQVGTATPYPSDHIGVIAILK